MVHKCRRKWNVTLRGFWILTSVLLLTACGGGGSTGPSFSPEPVVDQTLGGLWFGTLTTDGVQGNQDLVGITTDDGRFRFISVDTLGQFIGTGQTSGNDVTGSGNGFAPMGTTWGDGATVTPITVSATLHQRSSFSGTWGAGTGESGTFDFDYDADYEKSSSLALLVGVWAVYDDNSNPIVTFTIDAGGQFFGQNVNGCTSLGQISVIDSRANVYDITSTISDCFIAGDYAGLGVLGDIENPDDAFVFSVNNDVVAILLGLQR
jgi:hypothetical protein